MRIAIFGKVFSDDAIGHVQTLISELSKNKCKLIIYKPFYSFLSDKLDLPKEATLFSKHEEIKIAADILISIGGDGTILSAVTLVKDSGIPILGINTGRLGFLANTSKEDVVSAVKKIVEKKFYLDKRTLLEVSSSKPLFGEDHFALNELTVHKKDSASMITIDTFIDGNLLNTYWADGLIVSTPTGSTAYSLSCGGPIIVPGSENFIITPIAPHNLNVRPVVVNDDVEIKLKISGRGMHYLAALDSRTETIDASYELTVKKSKMTINLLQLEGEEFFNTLRNKLHWGQDKRN